VADRLQIKRDNASIWASVNPILSDGEFGFERDTNLLKIGNGSTPWNNLPYIPLVGSADSLTLTVRNNTGSTISKGSVVYINGAVGNKPTIALSQANTEALSSRTFGVVRSDIANNTEGVVVIQGSVPTLNTSTFSDGDYVYLSPTMAGGLTNSRPIQPNHAVTVGVITRAHPSLGSIEVRVQNGFEIEELHNVLIANKVTNDTVVYDSSTELWKNLPVGAAFATAGEDLGGHRVVVSLGGNLYYANTTNLAHKNRVVGLTLGATTVGAVSSYLKEGLITEPSWAWNTSLPVYLADNGLLTQTPVNVTGFVMIAGMPASSTSLYVSFQPSIIL
jgi:hypothetical protein